MKQRGGRRKKEKCVAKKRGIEEEDMRARIKEKIRQEEGDKMRE